MNNRRRKSSYKTLKKTLIKILLLPGKFPPVSDVTIHKAMVLCEMTGIIFAISLIASLSGLSGILPVINVISGAIFIFTMVFIKLCDYQDLLIKEHLADYVYIR